MKYLEELEHGQCFRYQNKYYILTTDFKSNGDKNCIDLQTGNIKWLNSSSIVDDIDIYTLDKDNTLVPLRERKNAYNIDKTQNIS
jgi:hypothetical protein